MLERLIGRILLWSLQGCVAWFVMHQAAGAVTDRLDEFNRALGALQAGLL